MPFAVPIALALIAAPIGAAAPAGSALPPAAHAKQTFARLKTLTGEWRDAANPASLLRIRFWTTAGGTVLVEEWRKGDAPHSLTLYHRDGSRLIATHYCPQGNQPRLALNSGSGLATPRFAFRDATDLDPASESHQHGLAFDLTDPARPVRSEIYRSATGADEPSRLVLMRE